MSMSSETRKLTLHELEEERKDAIFYRNSYMYELSEMALLGMAVKQLGTLEPEKLALELTSLLKKIEARKHEYESPEKTCFSR